MQSNHIARMWGFFSLMLWVIVVGQKVPILRNENLQHCSKTPSPECEIIMTAFRDALEVCMDAFCGFAASASLVWATFMVQPHNYVFCIVIELARLRLRPISIGALNFASVFSLATGTYMLFEGGFFNNYYNFRHNE